jgi:glycine oxidase
VVAADHVVIAAGAWTAELTAQLGVSLPVEPVRGELLRVRHGSRQVYHHLTCGPIGIYATEEGDLLLGGTQERVGFDDVPSEAGREILWSHAERLVPGIRGSRLIEQIVGLRPTTPDFQPVLGLLPGWANVQVASGGWSKGMLLAPFMAQVVCNVMAADRGCSASAVPRQMAVERFVGDSRQESR